VSARVVIVEAHPCWLDVVSGESIGSPGVTTTNKSPFLGHVAEALPGVREALDDLRSRLVHQLGDELIGLYLYGSLVLGDFDPQESDLDLLAALSGEVRDEHLPALRGLHAEFVRQHPNWDDRVEVAYVAAAALRTFKSQPSTVAIVSPGEPLHAKKVSRVSRGWLIDYYAVREHGITLLGPPPRALIDDISTDEFLDAVRRDLQTWREPLPHRSTRGPQRYAVLTICRGLYALRHGRQTSKKRAAVWVQREFPEWALVIERVLASTNRDAATEADHRETARFIEFALRAARVA
jgi:predicted nucleotidyltransferase